MLKVDVKCWCGKTWGHQYPDATVRSLKPERLFTTSLQLYCTYCGAPQPIEIEFEPNGEYVARGRGGPGSVTLTREPDDLFYDFDVEGYLRDVVASRPERVFLYALEELDVVMKTNAANEIAVPTFNRMIFNQLFAILETYLADRLIRLIEDNDDALQALISSHPSWKSDTIPLSDAFSAVTIARDRVMKKLVETLYHDFAKVDPIYKAVFKTSIFASPDDKDILFKNVKVRHDCVHRNGKATDGRKHEIGHDVISTLSSVIQRTYYHIETAYKIQYDPAE